MGRKKDSSKLPYQEGMISISSTSSTVHDLDPLLLLVEELVLLLPPRSSTSTTTTAVGVSEGDRELWKQTRREKKKKKKKAKFQRIMQMQGFSSLPSSTCSYNLPHLSSSRPISILVLPSSLEDNRRTRINESNKEDDTSSFSQQDGKDFMGQCCWRLIGRRPYFSPEDEARGLLPSSFSSPFSSFLSSHTKSSCSCSVVRSNMSNKKNDDNDDDNDDDPAFDYSYDHSPASTRTRASSSRTLHPCRRHVSDEEEEVDSLNHHHYDHVACNKDEDALVIPLDDKQDDEVAKLYRQDLLKDDLSMFNKKLSEFWREVDQKKKFQQRRRPMMTRVNEKTPRWRRTSSSSPSSSSQEQQQHHHHHVVAFLHTSDQPAVGAHHAR